MASAAVGWVLWAKCNERREIHVIKKKTHQPNKIKHQFLFMFSVNLCELVFPFLYLHLAIFIAWRCLRLRHRGTRRGCGQGSGGFGEFILKCLHTLCSMHKQTQFYTHQATLPLAMCCADAACGVNEDIFEDDAWIFFCSGPQENWPIVDGVVAVWPFRFGSQKCHSHHW